MLAKLASTSVSHQVSRTVTLDHTSDRRAESSNEREVVEQAVVTRNNLLNGSKKTQKEVVRNCIICSLYDFSTVTVLILYSSGLKFINYTDRASLRSNNISPCATKLIATELSYPTFLYGMFDIPRRIWNCECS